MDTVDGLIIAHSVNEASGFSGYTRGYTVGHNSCLLDDERILELMIFLGLLSPLLTNVTFFHWPDISTAVSPCLLAAYSADLQRATKGRTGRWLAGEDTTNILTSGALPSIRPRGSGRRQILSSPPHGSQHHKNDITETTSRRQ